jgi:hypothetical protein
MAIYTYIIEQTMTVRYTVAADELTEDMIEAWNTELLPRDDITDVLDVQPLTDSHKYVSGSLRHKKG